MWSYNYSDELMHFGVKGMRWGVRRYQNEDGSYTSKGKKHRGLSDKAKKTLKKVAIGAGAAAVAGLGIYAAVKTRQYVNGKKLAQEMLESRKRDTARRALGMNMFDSDRREGKVDVTPDNIDRLSRERADITRRVFEEAVGSTSRSDYDSLRKNSRDMFESNLRDLSEGLPSSRKRKKR